MSAESPWDAVLLSFFEAPKSVKPDVKALARLLRSDEPLPEAFRTGLAELLDSQLPGPLACNWQLRPEWAGLYDDEAHREKKEKQVKAALAKAPSVNKAVVVVAGMSESTARRTLRKMKRREKWIADSRAAQQGDVAKLIADSWAVQGDCHSDEKD